MLRGTVVDYFKEKKARLYVLGAVILVLVVGGSFLAGSRYGGNKTAQPGRKILHYVDPMNPAHTSSEPGLAPCGMKMEPVYADAEGSVPGPKMPPGTVKISPTKQQLIGVKVETVKKAPWTYRVRMVGKVAIDDTRIYRVNAFTEGWILKTFDNSTGSLVKEDEPLASFYTREFVTAESSYLHALVTLDRIMKGDQVIADQLALTTWQVRAAEEALENLGMSKSQIKELARTRQLTQTIFIKAPATSFVLTRNVSPGQKFERGAELYKLADLSHVWILADLFEYEAPYVKPGEKVQVTLPDQRKSFLATVSEVLPLFDPATRTLKVRLETDNPDYSLKPDMFVDLEFPVKLPPTISVPVDAVLDSGLKQTVFVDRGKGYFEPRKVTTGWRYGDRVQIVSGLAPGDRIAVSGNFLIDSESRMKLAAAGIFGEVSKDPVCGMDVDQNKSRAAGWKTEYGHKAYFFCSDECKAKFAVAPERYLHLAREKPKEGAPPPVKPEQVASGPARDPVCGQEVDKAKAVTEGLTTKSEGKTYYFCSKPCKERFNQGAVFYQGMPSIQVRGAGPPAKDLAPVPESPGQSAPGAALPSAPFRPPVPTPDFKGHAAPGHPALPVPGHPAPPAPPQAAAPPPQAVAGHPPHAAAGPRQMAMAKGSGAPPVQGPQAAAAALTKDPVCGMSLNQRQAQTAGLMSPYGNRVYFFCSEDCKAKFDLAPARYAGKIKENQAKELTPEEEMMQMRPGAERDPVCGLPIDKIPAEKEKRTSNYKGKIYYFCGDDCREKFESNPESFLKKQKASSLAEQQAQPHRGPRQRGHHD